MGVKPKEDALGKVVERLSQMTEEEIRDSVRQSKARSEERERDRNDRRNRTGEYDPANALLGKCRVCVTGDIIEKVRRHHTSTGRIGGSHGYSYAVNDGYFCKGCGLRYEFVPKA